MHMDTDVLGYDKLLKILRIYFTDTDGNVIDVNDIQDIVYSEAFRDIYLCYK